MEAKEEAIREKSSRSNYLNDDNLYNVVSNLFQAGTDTSKTTLSWSILFLANDPELQEEIHKEITDKIGDRKPTQCDKDCLPLTNAFIMEVLRLRPPVSLGLDHQTGHQQKIEFQKLNNRFAWCFFAWNFLRLLVYNLAVSPVPSLRPIELHLIEPMDLNAARPMGLQPKPRKSLLRNLQPINISLLESLGIVLSQYLFTR